jgi:hypothetical protein
MSEWKPRVKAGLRWESLTLTAEDGFLLSRIDGATSVKELSHVTGLSVAQVQDGLRRLRTHGALDADPAAAAPAAPAAPAATSARPPSPTAPAARATAAVATPPRPDDDDDDDALFDDIDEVASAVDGEVTEEGDAEGGGNGDGEDAPARPDAGPAGRRDAAAYDDGAGSADGSADGDDGDDDGNDDGGGNEAADDDRKDGDGADDEIEEGNHRKLYETTLHALPQAERERLAKTASGPTLLALCFDPVPQVVGGIFENPEVGFPHARLVARHHRTPQGLDDVLRRAEFARDAQVQRFLLANPMLNDAQLKKLLAPRRLDVVYKWALSRDLPEKNRAKVRLILRSKWSTADGEARAHLVFSTEGRALTMLIGLPFDSQTTTLLCARTYNSLMLIQNLARFSSTPPQVLQHLLKQALVKRQPHLRMLIAQHPNCPSDVKRKLREG